MTQEDADKLIAEWQSKIAFASENLFALDDTITMERIEGRSGFTKLNLSGVTEARVTPAIAAMRELFDQLGTLNATVERAVQLRRSLSRLWKYEETLREIERLLTGPSIPLPEIQTPLSQRSLISASQNRQTITPDRLLTAMVTAFQTARDAVVAVESAWQHLESGIDIALTKVQALEQQAAALGLTVPPLIEARQRIGVVQSRLLTDPLSLKGDLGGQIAPLLSAANEYIEKSRQEREQSETELASARVLLTEVTRIHASAGATFAACQQRFSEADNVLAPQSEIRLLELERWLLSLEAAKSSNQWRALCVGLQRWTETAEALRDEERKTQSVNESLLEMPLELRGRLSALRARARKSATDTAALERLALQADALLREPRIPLDRATKIIAACEARLRQ